MKVITPHKVSMHRLFEDPNFLRPYVSVEPKPVSRRIITNFVKSLDTRVPHLDDPSEYHITVVYALNECNLSKIKKSVVHNREYNVEMAKADVFVNEDEQTAHLVLLVRSPELHEYNAFLMQQGGLRSSFPDYKPHITIASNLHNKQPSMTFENTVDLYTQAAEELSEALKDGGVPLVFSNASVTRIKD